jgi:cytochrome c oxidase cbb3-type subunit 1
MTSEHSPNDRASRWPLLLLLFSGALWLVASGVLGVIASVQVHTPAFLSGCAVLTHGRVAEMAQTSFVYGWLANAGLGLALFVLGRLSGEPLRAQSWALIGTAFWNLGVTAALVGIATGDATGFALLGLPRYVQFDMIFSYAAIALPGILAWSGRLRRVSFASHWYAAAALFLFPWLLSAAHVILFALPPRGVVQAIAAGWYAQGAWTLWIAPMFLSVAYYVAAKATGRELPTYEFAALGFWCLVFVGGLTGGRHLVGGPVPAWIAAVAVVSSALLLFHTMVVVLNLRGAAAAAGLGPRFVAFGIAAYAAGSVGDAATSFLGVAVRTEFTFFDEALRQLSLYGAATSVLLGGIYFAVPRITGKAWLSGRLARAHMVMTFAGVALLVASLVAASAVQIPDLLDARIPFSQITHDTRPWLLGATGALAILLAGNIALLVNLYATACEILDISKPAVFNPPAAAETHAS